MSSGISDQMDFIREVMASLPGAEEYICYGTISFRVNKKFLLRLREDEKTLAIRNEERDKWIEKNPSVYFITDHYQNYPTMLIELSQVKKKELAELLITAWKSRATKKQLKEWEEKNKTK